MLKKLVKYILLMLAIAILIFAISSSIFNCWIFSSYDPLVSSLSYNILYTMVLGGLNGLFFYGLGKIAWKPGQEKKRALIGIIGSIPVTFIGLVLLKLFQYMYLEQHDFEYFITHQKWSSYSFSLWISLTIVLAFHAFYFYKAMQEKKVKDSQIVAKTETARFESLKNQLDPHFLFNSLNVLTSLIDENPKGAQRFTTGLSKVYRYILEQKNKDLVDVPDEIAFANTYMQLLKTRFEEGIEFEIDEALNELEFKIVPLSLQLLLENAVKHNVITSQKPLRIKIYKEQNMLVVQNSFNPKQVVEKSTKVGLENIKQRYQLIIKKEVVQVIEEHQLFIVKLPLLNKNIKIMDASNLSASERYLRAQKRVEEITGFYWNLASYCLVMPFLIFINYVTFWENKWFLYPMFGWGLGICLNAVKVFVLGTQWRDRKIKEIMDKG